MDFLRALGCTAAAEEEPRRERGAVRPRHIERAYPFTRPVLEPIQTPMSCDFVQPFPPLPMSGVSPAIVLPPTLGVLPFVERRWAPEPEGPAEWSGSFPSQFPSARHRLRQVAAERSPGGYICSAGAPEKASSPYVWNPTAPWGTQPDPTTIPCHIPIVEEQRPSGPAKVPTFGQGPPSPNPQTRPPASTGAAPPIVASPSAEPSPSRAAGAESVLPVAVSPTECVGPHLEPSAPCGLFESYMLTSRGVCWEESDVDRASSEEALPSTCICQTCAGPARENVPSPNSPLASDLTRKKIAASAPPQVVAFVTVPPPTKPAESEKETATSEGLGRPSSPPPAGLPTPPHETPPRINEETDAPTQQEEPSDAADPPKTESSTPTDTPDESATVVESKGAEKDAGESSGPKGPQSFVMVQRHRTCGQYSCCSAFKQCLDEARRSSGPLLETKPVEGEIGNSNVTTTAEDEDATNKVSRRKLSCRAAGPLLNAPVKRPETSAASRLLADRELATALYAKGQRFVRAFSYLDRGLYAVLWPSTETRTLLPRAETVQGSRDDSSTIDRRAVTLMHTRVTRLLLALPDEVFCFVRIRIDLGHVQVANMGRQEVFSRLGSVALRKWLTPRNLFFTRAGAHRRSLSLSYSQPPASRSKTLPPGGDAPWRRGDFESLDAFCKFYDERTQPY